MCLTTHLESALCHTLPGPTCTAASGRSASKLLMRNAYVQVHNANEDLMQRNRKHGKKALVGLAPEKVLPPKLLYQPCPVIKGAEAEAFSIEVRPDLCCAARHLL